MKGYGGRILHVDLTRGDVRVEPVSETTARTLLGGNGLAARLLHDHVPAGVDAFDPGNAVVFAVGPVTDTTVPGNSRACVAAKSPRPSYRSASDGRGSCKRSRVNWSGAKAIKLPWNRSRWSGNPVAAVRLFQPV